MNHETVSSLRRRSLRPYAWVDSRSLLMITSLMLSSGLMPGCGLLKKRAPVEEGASGSATAGSTGLALTATTAQGIPPSALPGPGLPAIEAVALPTPEDFEEEAFAKITTKNMQAEINRLSKEIGE